MRENNLYIDPNQNGYGDTIAAPNGCMLMSAVACNPKKLMKFTAKTVKAGAKALQKGLETSLLELRNYSCASATRVSWRFLLFCW